jgi:hypothetical protein
MIWFLINFISNIAISLGVILGFCIVVAMIEGAKE